MTVAQLINWIGAGKTAAGVQVSEEKALSLPAVFSVIDRLSSVEAALPLHLYKRIATGKKLADDRNLYSILHDAANPLMTAVQFRKTMMIHLLLWGNAFSWIERDTSGQIVALWPLDPAQTSVLVSYTGVPETVPEMNIVYQTTFRGQTRKFMSYDVLHLMGFSLDGIVGLSPIRLEREAIGLGLSMQQMMGFLVANNATPPIVLQTPPTMGHEAAKNLHASWMRRNSGENAGQVGLLEEGAQVVKLDQPLKDIEFLGQRGYTVKDVARIYNVPLAMLAEDQTATYASAEQFDLWLVKYTLTPWLVIIEQGIALKLLTAAERKKFYAKHALEGLLRGNAQARSQFYKAMAETGFYSINNVLELEDMNTIGPDGDKHMVPLNYTTIDQLGKAPEAVRSLEPVYLDAYGRILRRAKADITREAERRAKNGSLDGFAAWLDDFLEEHQAFAERALRPACEAEGRAGEAESLAKTHAKRLKDDLKALTNDPKTAGDALISGISERFSVWLDNPKEVFTDERQDEDADA